MQTSESPLDFPPAYQRPTHASIVIPTWNGRDLLEKYLPSVIEATTEGDEVIVVDNDSSDGSAAFVRKHFPQVTLIEAESNLGFGGGNNLGVRAARNRIVVVLNNDMRVMPDFLQPLLDGFTDDQVFAVTAQIFFSDPDRRREETGLTAGYFERGFLRVTHKSPDGIPALYPTFYAGGGSAAYDRDKFLELGGFDPLFEPFYVEDTDLSYCAWRRGWKVLYQPNSRVYHEHRATISKNYTPQAIRRYLQKNYVLMVWKNVHNWQWLLQHFFYLYGHLVLSAAGSANETRTSLRAFLMAMKQLPQAIACRSKALLRASVDDRAAMERTRPSIFRDVFCRPREREQPQSQPLPPVQHWSRSAAEQEANRGAPGAVFQLDFTAAGLAAGEPLNILFVSPYSIYPPIHGGAVFMLQAIQELAKRHNLYVLTFVDRREEVESNLLLERSARKVEVYMRQEQPRKRFSMHSNAEHTFRDPHFAALLDQMVFLHDIDIIQFEYTQLAQYHLPLQHTPQCLFEHDVYFQSVARQLFSRRGGLLVKSRELLEWLRSLRFEVGAVQKFDAIFTCHEEEKRLLESMLNGRRPPIFSDLRALIDVSMHSFPGGPRQPDTLLFVGNFQHRPNVEGLLYFCREVLPLIRARRHSVILEIVGANATPELRQKLPQEGVRFLGQVPDIREPLSRSAVFVCPILVGAGMRVKILEAFASGIPVVSTRIGAEGLAGEHGAHLMLADSPADFAGATLYLLDNPDTAREMAANARQFVEASYDWPAAALKLEEIYRQLIASRAG